MNKILLAVILFSIAFACNAQTVRVEGIAEGVPNRTKLFVYRNADIRKPTDSAIVENGKFQFSIKMENMVYRLAARKPFISLNFIPDAQNIRIKIIGSDHFVEGGKLQGRLNNYEKVVKGIEQKNIAFNRNMEAAGNDVLKKSELTTLSAQLFDNSRNLLLKQVLINKDNFLGGYLAKKDIIYWGINELDTILSSLDTTTSLVYINQLKAKKEELLNQLVIGKEAINFELKDMQGNTVTFFDKIAENEYVLIDFWASWCAPCRTKNKEIYPLYEKYRSKGFEVISVSFDKNATEWKKAVHQDGIQWIQVNMPDGFESEVGKYYKVKALPSTYLIDKQKMIIDQNIGHSELKKFLLEKLY